MEQARKRLQTLHDQLRSVGHEDSMLVAKEREASLRVEQVRELNGVTEAWTKLCASFFNSLEIASVEILAGDSETITRMRKSGIEPGLKSLLDLSTQKIESTIDRAESELSQDMHDSVDPKMKALVLQALKTDACGRIELNMMSAAQLKEVH